LWPAVFINNLARTGLDILKKLSQFRQELLEAILIK
jgi:hypothetical protein